MLLEMVVDGRNDALPKMWSSKYQPRHAKGYFREEDPSFIWLLPLEMWRMSQAILVEIAQ
jgi:hypothetical protein